MRINSMCMACLLSKQEKQIRNFNNEEEKDEYLREVMRLMLDEDAKYSAPECVDLLDRLYEKTFAPLESTWEMRKDYNEQVLAEMDFVKEVIENATDPLEAALKAARVGNYIDCAALPVIEKDMFVSLLHKIEDETLDEKVYHDFKMQLANGSRFVYITDNCGEIVLDKACIEEIKKLYPHLEITVIVRGGEVVNDATMDDAKQIGLTDVCTVIGNGTRIAGTSLRNISEDARRCIENADVILAKGQGNHESLSESGLNIYYLLLCKCERYTKKFGVEQFAGVFAKERE